jgi:hypothetical protein
MARAQGARAQMALGFETAYGTPPASGQFWRMPFAQANLGAEQPLLASELLGYGRDPVAPIGDAITSDGEINVPIDARFWGVWLKGAFGAPITTEDTGVYTHEFRSGGWALPSMAIEIGMPEVPHFGMNAGCMVNQISWSMQRSGLITATVGLIGQGETIASATAAGALNSLELSRFGAFHGSVRREGATLGNVVSAQITYTNNLDRIETIRADGKIDGADPSLANLTGTIEVRFADHVLIDQALAGDPAEIEFGFSTGADLSFTLTAHAVYLPKPRLALQGPGGVQASFAWQAAQDAGLGRMATATLVNDVPDYDNPGL